MVSSARVSPGCRVVDAVRGHGGGGVVLVSSSVSVVRRIRAVPRGDAVARREEVGLVVMGVVRRPDGGRPAVLLLLGHGDGVGGGGRRGGVRVRVDDVVDVGRVEHVGYLCLALQHRHDPTTNVSNCQLAVELFDTKSVCPVLISKV